MASFLTRLVACLVAIIAILQLIHLVLLNKLESERLLELHHFQSYSSERELQEEIKVVHLQHQRQQPRQQEQQHRHNSDNSLPNPSFHSSAMSSFPADSIINGRARRSQMARNEIHQQKDGNDHQSTLDSTKKFRIISDLYRFISVYPQDPTLSNNNAAAASNPVRTKSSDDDFSIDNENEAANTGDGNANVFQSLPDLIVDNDVTLVLHGTVRNVQEHLLDTVERWLGPISVAVFAQTASELNRTVIFVHQAVQCHQLTKEVVKFYLVFPTRLEDNFQTLLLDRSWSLADSTAGGVTKSKPTGKKSKKKKQRGKTGNSKKLNMCQKFYHKLSNSEPSPDQDQEPNNNAEPEPQPAVSVVEYPVNLLRNVARKNTRTKYTLVCDIELVPSELLRTRFQNFIKSSRVDNSKTVFVVPAFEVMNRRIQDVPGNKEQLLTLLEKYEARPYSFDICWKCQVNTDYETWQRESSSNTQELSILVESLWRDPWEPYFISDNSAPFYEERFTLSSHQPLQFQSQPSDYARLSQLCELHTAGFKFAILKDVFLVHNGFRDLSDISSSLTSSSLAAAAISSSNTDTNFDTVQSNYEAMKLGLRDKYPESTRTCD